MTTATLEVQDVITPADATTPDDVLADLVSTSTPADDAIDRDTWAIACHESGHAVAANVLRGLSARALVWRDGDDDVQGVTLMAGHIGGFHFRRCIILACGSLAERLARSHPRPTPQASRRVKLEADSPKTVDCLHRLLREAQPLSDEAAMARMFGTFNTVRSGGWRSYRHREISVKWHARCFIREHKHKILDVAERLYIEGQITLKGTWNNDDDAIELTDYDG